MFGELNRFEVVVSGRHLKSSSVHRLTDDRHSPDKIPQAVVCCLAQCKMNLMKNHAPKDAASHASEYLHRLLTRRILFRWLSELIDFSKCFIICASLTTSDNAEKSFLQRES
jgi:hypothetical protein